MQAHYPAMTEAQTGTFENAKNLNRRIGCLRLKRRFAREVAQLFERLINIHAHCTAIKCGETVEYFVPEFDLLILLAVEPARSGPAENLELLLKKIHPMRGAVLPACAVTLGF